MEIVLDKDFSQIYILDEYESLIWSDRYNSYGDFELLLPANKYRVEIFQLDRYIWRDDSDHLMIIEEVEIESNFEDGDKLLIKGRSLESLLERRIVWKQSILNGNIQNIIKKLLDENVISPDNPNRAIPNFIFQESEDEELLAINVRTQFTGDTIYDAISQLCLDQRIGFKIVLNDENQMVFSLYKGVNRSYSQNKNPWVVFSPEYDNLVSSNYYRTDTNLRNVALVAGEGEGVDRKTVTLGDVPGLERRELYVDARDISSITEQGILSETDYQSLLQQRGISKLADRAFIETFEGEVEATKLYTYGQDFFIGDVVQINNAYGIESKARIGEIVRSKSTAGITTIPTFTVV